jgi:hypothetical protein
MAFRQHVVIWRQQFSREESTNLDGFAIYLS